MTEAVRRYCEKTGQRVPETTGELAAVIYQSLAKCYGETVGEIEQLTGEHYDTIHIVGGGAKAGYLNDIDCNAAGRRCWQGHLRQRQSEI